MAEEMTTEVMLEWLKLLAEGFHLNWKDVDKREFDISCKNCTATFEPSVTYGELQKHHQDHQIPVDTDTATL